MSIRHLLVAPRLWPAESSKDRRVTWLELFFDLIFVAAIAQVGTPLSHDYTPMGLFRYTFLFVLIWLAWSGNTLYFTRFDTDDLVQRVFTLVQSFIAAVMAANAKDALDSTSSAGFGAAYAGMRIILVMQYLRARRIPQTRTLTTRYAIGFGTAAAIWLASALVPTPARFILWGVALTIDLATPFVAPGHSSKYPPDAAHFPERFGLFTIILLGEFVVAIMRGIESQENWPIQAASSAILGMVFAFATWWWYFEGAKASAERHVKTKKQAILFHVWNYAHLPLFLGIAISGIGIYHVIALPSGMYLPALEAKILAYAVAMMMAAMVTIGATSEAAQKREGLANFLWPQYLLTAAVAILGTLSTHLLPVLLVLAFTLICLAQVMLAQRETFIPRRSMSGANSNPHSPTIPISRQELTSHLS
jgi:low temperature requirement protein LtrA